MAATRTVTKKPAARKPAARTTTPATKAPARHPELHGAAALVDRMLRLTEHTALRVAVMAKRGRRSLLQHA